MSEAASRVEFGVGCHINVAAAMLVAAAKDGEAEGVFNDITLRATSASTVDEIVADFNRQSEALSIAWRNSPEGIAAAEEREARARAAQEKHDALMRDLASLDFTNDVAVLDWLCAIQDATDHVSVVVSKAEILDAFKRHGFEVGANCGDAFKADDRDNHFRWIVGQALATLQSVAIHGIIHKFTDDWKAKFLEVQS